jgi:hypothetical protein
MRKLTSNKTPIIMGGGGILLTLALVLVFTTCDIGLGKLVNTEKPIIGNAGDNNQPGAFMQGGGNKIELDVENKLGFKIETVYMEIEYVDKVTGELKRKQFPATMDPETKKWVVDLDVSDMEDGEIKAWVTAIDSSGNETTTTQMTYFVKNKLPQIEMTIPVINTEKFDDNLFLSELIVNDPVFRRFSLMGVATDNYGMEPGFPKIMIWPSDSLNVDTDDLPSLDANGKPLDEYGYWYSMEDIPNGYTTATRFSWPMLTLKYDANNPVTATVPQGGKYRLPEKDDTEGRENFVPLGDYRFRIWTKDRFGNDNFYPDRTDHGQTSSSKKYVQIRYKSPGSIAIASPTDVPQYYNMAKNLEITILLDKGEAEIHPTTPVRAMITKSNAITSTNLNTNPSDPNILWHGYAIKETETRFKLDITATTANSWSLPSDNQLYVKAWAVDASATSTTYPVQTQRFLIDKTPPELTIDRPIVLANRNAGSFSDGGAYIIQYPTEPRPKWVTGNITVGGAPKDASGSGVKEIFYHFGPLNDDNASEALRKTRYDTATWYDTRLHTNVPLASDIIGGKWSGTQFSWTWEYNFPKTFKTDRPTLVQLAADLGYTTGSQEWAYKRTDGDRTRFYLPFYVKVVDNADNYRIIHYTLCVDPDMDEPRVTITQPEIKEADVKPIVGGTVRIAGYAEDNFWMHTVLMRVKKYGVSTYYLPPNTPLFYPANPSYPAPLVGAGPNRDTDGWFLTTKQGDSSTINWYANINQLRELDPTGARVDVTIEVVAIDCDENDLNHNTTHIVGPIETLVVEFSKDVPIIDTPVIKKANVADRTWSDGIKAAGLFTVNTKIEAIGNDINNLSVRVNNSSQPVILISEKVVQPLNAAAWTLGPKVTSGGRVSHTLTVTIDSTKTNMIAGLSSIAGFDYGKTGNLTLEITAEDSSSNHLTTTNTFNIGIDNLYPTAEIQTPTVASEDTTAGKYFFVQGTAKDFITGSEVVQGLERVLVYFEKANIDRTGGTRKIVGSTNYIKPNGGGVTAANDFVTYPFVLDHGGSSTTASLAPNVNSYARYPKLTEYTTSLGEKKWKSDSAMVIDTAENIATSDIDGDGTYGEIWNGSSSNREWGARIIFTGWADGPYIVHYLIMDQAGNAVHYQSDIYVENNKPRIINVNFGTDINGVGNVTDGTSGTLDEYLYPASGLAINNSTISSIAGVVSPSFRIRGGMFDVKLSFEKGNNNKTAKITYVTRGTETEASNMTRGNAYEISNFGTANTDFTKYGASNNIAGTIFIATGPVPVVVGIGKVYPYTGTRSASVNNAANNVTLHFTNFDNADDSHKDPSGDVDVHNARYFLVKVYDTTIAASVNGADAELDQLSDALLVRLDIDNVDSKKPTLSLLPFGQEYYVDANSIPPFNNPANDAARRVRDLSDADYIKNISMGLDEDGNYTVKEGYVQYKKHNKDLSANTNISGKVKFIGKVEDNQRIAGIYVTISNYSGVGTTAAGTQFQIARANTTTGLLEAVNPDATHTGHWQFKILDNNYLTLEFGHSLSWEFMWDSSKVVDVARNNVTVTFQARDAKPTTPNNSDNAGENPLTVNVVPYISEVVTSLSGAYSPSSVFNRSATGAYPVREGGSVTIKGFNMGTFTTDTAAAYVRINNTASTFTITSNNGTSIVGTIPAVAVSGELVVRVNNINSFNNVTTIKNNGVAYNKEPNNTNNNNLVNSRYIYIWTTGDLFGTGTYTNTSDGSGPGESINFSKVSDTFMRIDNNGNRLISHAYYPDQNQGRLRVLRNNTVIDLGTANTNRISYTTVGTGGKNASFYAAGMDTSSLEAGNRGFQLGLSNAAGTNSILNHLNNANAAVTGNATTDSRNYVDHGNIRIYNTYNAAADRFKIPRIAVLNSAGATRSNSNTDKFLLCYYDKDTSRVEAIYGTVGDDHTINPGNPLTITTSVSPGTTRTGLGTGTNPQYGYTYTFSNPSPISVVTSTTGSMYTAAGILRDGKPVIAWYDNSGSRLLFSVGTVSGTTVTWGAATEITTGKGTHVDMAVDTTSHGTNDSIHIAYYSNDGGLWYTYIPCTASTPTLGSRSTVRVDTFLSAGTRLMINVRGGKPYISYAHASFPGTKQSARVAWRVSADTGAAGSNANNTFTGNWEVMTVPVNGIPNDTDFICNGVPTATSWTAPASGLTYSNLNQTIIVGYMTATAYEGAILKGNILSVPTILLP